MKLGRFVWLALIGTLFAAAPSVYAQDTLLTGIVRDNTGGVLPGVTRHGDARSIGQHVRGRD